MELFQAVFSLFSWMPSPFREIAIGVVLIYVLMMLFKVVGLILDAIPFL